MELQHQQSCGQPVAVPTLSTAPDEVPTHPHRGILQERSANWPHEYHTTTSPPLKESRSPSPVDKAYSCREPHNGAYFTGNIDPQPFGLANNNIERSEKQIRYELERLYKMLARSEKYQKYREKQPVLTPAEFVAREAREEAKAKERGEQARKASANGNKETTVWPDFLEHAFWRALVRWPPMGRKKYMLEGSLRGRNELIQDSIFRDTGIRRNRKKVSSHLQVLKQHLTDQPAVIAYMASPDDKKCVRGSTNAYHSSHIRSARYAFSRTALSARYAHHDTSTQEWSRTGSWPANSGAGAEAQSPFEVSEFAMLVENDEQPVHYFTQLANNGRLDDLHVSNLASWRRQFPEFNFLRSQTEDWARQNRKVLVCDASIKVMTDTQHGQTLTTTFSVHSQRDLTHFASSECVTRFYDEGDMSLHTTFDGQDARDLKEHRTACLYMAESSHLYIAFGSKFWVNRMLVYEKLRHKDENRVRKSLMNLTAIQDVYGIHKVTGKAECILTILWRFTQTRSSAEVGCLNWRAVNFDNHLESEEQAGIKEEKPSQQEQQHDLAVLEIPDSAIYNAEIMTTDIMDMSTQPYHALSHQQQQHPLYDSSLSLHPQLPFQPPSRPHSHPQFYATAPIVPPHLSFSILSPLPQDLHSAPSTATTSFSHQGPHTATTTTASSFAVPDNTNEFDFHGGHITISGAFDPSIALDTYSTFEAPLHENGGNEVEGVLGMGEVIGEVGDDVNVDFEGLGLVVGENGELVSVVPRTGDFLQQDTQAELGEMEMDLGLYSMKPLHGWQCEGLGAEVLIRDLERAAEEQGKGYEHGHGHDQTSRLHATHPHTDFDLTGANEGTHTRAHHHGYPSFLDPLIQQHHQQHQPNLSILSTAAAVPGYHSHDDEDDFDAHLHIHTATVPSTSLPLHHDPASSSAVSPHPLYPAPSTSTTTDNGPWSLASPFHGDDMLDTTITTNANNNNDNSTTAPTYAIVREYETNMPPQQQQQQRKDSHVSLETTGALELGMGFGGAVGMEGMGGLNGCVLEMIEREGGF